LAIRRKNPESDQTELDLYKEKVRQIAIEANQRYGNTNEIDKVLEAVGLEKLPVPRRYRFEVPFTAKLRYSVTATSEAEALEAAGELAAKDRGQQTNYYGRVVERTVEIGDEYTLIETVS
jgi:hypothetical protein